MKSYIIDSVPRNLCNQTSKDILDVLESCRVCGNIPLPCFRSNKDKNEYSFCKKCYLLKNEDIEECNQVTRYELNMLSKLKISCKNFEKECKEVFCINTLKELLDHEKTCAHLASIISDTKETRISYEKDVLILLEKIDKVLTNQMGKCIKNYKEINEKMALNHKIQEENIIKIQKISDRLEEFNQNFKIIQEKNEKTHDFNLIHEKLDFLKEEMNRNRKNFDKISNKCDKIIDIELTKKEEITNEFCNMKEQFNKSTTKWEDILLSSKKINENIRVREESSVNFNQKLIPNNIILENIQVISDKTYLKLNEITVNQINFQKSLESSLISKYETETKSTKDSFAFLLNQLELIQKKENTNFKRISSKHNSENLLKLKNDMISKLYKVFNSVNDIKKHLQNQKFYLTKTNYLIPYKRNFANNIKLGEHSNYIYAILQISENLVITCSNDNFIKIWDLITKQCIRSIYNNSHVYCITKLSEELIASGGNDNTIYIWEIKTGKLTQRLVGHYNFIRFLTKLSNGYLASCAGDETIGIWDFKNNVLIQQLDGHRGIVWCLNELTDGRLASAGADKTIKIWKKNFEIDFSIFAHKSEIRSVIEVSPDIIASGGHDKILKIWKISTRECILKLKGHTNYVLCLSLLSDGKLVSGSADSSVKIWDLESKQCIQTLNRHSGYVNSLIELSDGRLASVSGDKSILIWI
jgi:WD40 repeat protein